MDRLLEACCQATSTRLDTDQGEQCSERATGHRTLHSTSIPRKLCKFYFGTVSRTDTRMTGSYLCCSVNWVQSARRTTERGRAPRTDNTNNNKRDATNERLTENECDQISATFLIS